MTCYFSQSFWDKSGQASLPNFADGALTNEILEQPRSDQR
jgi:hypothetical protein